MRSLVVNQVHDLALLESKHAGLVAGDTQTPFAGPIPLQWMQSEGGRVRAVRMRCFLQPEQDSPKPRDEARGQLRWLVCASMIAVLQTIDRGRE